MSDVGADVFAEWRVVPENVVTLSVLRLAIVVGSQTPYMYIYIYLSIYIYIYIYIYKYIYIRLCNNCMLRPLRKANAETRRVFNKALKMEAHSPLCKLYIYIYIYINVGIESTLV